MDRCAGSRKFLPIRSNQGRLPPWVHIPANSRVRVLDPFVGLGCKYSFCGMIQTQFATALSPQVVPLRISTVGLASNARLVYCRILLLGISYIQFATALSLILLLSTKARLLSPKARQLGQRRRRRSDGGFHGGPFKLRYLTPSV